MPHLRLHIFRCGAGLGTVNNSLTLGIGNGGPTGPIQLTSVTVQGTDFSLGQNSCPSSIGPFFGCGVFILFKPTAIGLRTGLVTVVASDSVQPHAIQLQGTGINGGIGTLSTTSLNFAAQTVGTSSAAQQITFTNTGSTVLRIGQVNASPTFFLASNNCNANLGVGKHCSISVKFAPTLAGIVVGTLTVTDDGGNSPHSVSLNGIGQ